MKIIYTLSLMMYASLPMLAMDQQDVMTTKLPNDVLNGIGRYVADINVKDVFILSMANRKLRSIFTTDALAKLVTFARLIKIIPYDTKDSRISQSTASSLHIKKHIKEVRNRDSRYLGTARIAIESPLNYSIYMGQHALTKFLFEAGVPYDSQSLLVAIAAYNKPALKLLLDRGAKPDERHDQTCGCKKQKCHCGERITFTPHDLALSTRIERFYEGDSGATDMFPIVRDAQYPNQTLLERLQLKIIEPIFKSCLFCRRLQQRYPDDFEVIAGSIGFFMLICVLAMLTAQ